MKQVLQSLRSGATEIIETPCPSVPPGHLLIRTACSVVSTGTERMLIEFGKAGIIDKARQQPDKVRMVLDKMRTDGIGTTLRAVRHKLDQPVALGYSNAGIVIDLGEGVTGYAKGDRVASNGRHAELVCVPANLCAKVPEAASDEAAAFTTLGAIALQGVRLAMPTLGETFAVIGLGLIGQLTVQILRAHGCRVVGIDPDPERMALARTFGATTSAPSDAERDAVAYTGGRGVDGVIITASTSSSKPVQQAATMCRKRGRIVLVGVTGLELSRADFYEKEITFQVSCSYGPGRYDPVYEDKGHDYPIGFVRWTEQRNFEAVLDLIAEGRIAVAPLISHRFAIADAEQAYAVVAGETPSLGVLLTYPPGDRLEAPLRAQTVPIMRTASVSRPAARPLSIGVIGSGNYATGVLIPAFKAAGVTLQTIASGMGLSAAHAGRKFGFATATTDVDSLIGDPALGAVVIATRHDTHAALAVKALRAGKHVFVEKPLGLSGEEIDAIEAAYREAGSSAAGPLLMVGFNRRFAPLVRRMKAMVDALKTPKAMIMTVNAGQIPKQHWSQSEDAGGGRILGEACHFVDLARFLASAPIVSRQCLPMRSDTGDTASLHLGFADGSTAAIHYFANGDRRFGKERIEVFSGGRILALDNFRRLTAYGWSMTARRPGWTQDKGQNACVAAFVEAITNGAPSPIPFEEIIEVSRTTIDLAHTSL
jgi:predicted dehydrogenase